MNTEEAVENMIDVIRRKHFTLNTERSYSGWLRQYCDFVYDITPHIPSDQKLERFLTAPAKKNIAASTQNQAFTAIRFFTASQVSTKSHGTAKKGVTQYEKRSADYFAVCLV